jgi:hypothetical protein
VTSQALRPTRLDIAYGSMIGIDPSAPGLPRIPAGLSPLEALEQRLMPALCRPPCLVASSGGRDSSAVLAVTASVARREGLSLPIPTTIPLRPEPTRELARAWARDAAAQPRSFDAQLAWRLRRRRLRAGRATLELLGAEADVRAPRASFEIG